MKKDDQGRLVFASAFDVLYPTGVTDDVAVWDSESDPHHLIPDDHDNRALPAGDPQ